MTTIYFIFLIIALVVLFVAVLYMFEMGFVSFSRSAPELPSQRRMRAAVADAIEQYFPGAATVLDVGSGWGGFVRYLARRFPNMQVVGIERMPAVFVVSRIMSIFGPRRASIKFGDFDKFIQDRRFDLAVCYSGPRLMRAVDARCEHFGAIISLDFPIAGRKADSVINLHRDFLGQHKVFIYMNR